MGTRQHDSTRRRVSLQSLRVCQGVELAEVGCELAGATYKGAFQLVGMVLGRADSRKAHRHVASNVTHLHTLSSAAKTEGVTGKS